MIDLKAARQLLDFGADIVGERRATEQLEGAVALHNIMEQHRVAYLADEVGMGKTLVALGALALFRHYRPDFRVLIIAPRENIQRKWIKEFVTFTTRKVRVSDLRVRSLRGGPARPLVACPNLHSFVHEVGVDSRRDFFLRLTSFSLGLRDTDEAREEARRHLRRELPWLDREALSMRSKQAFKDNYARAVCCALPVFDLVIVDEGHNLKHGFGESVSSRNRMLALAMGRDDQPDPRLFPGYGPRARRVLFLSATPIEDSYRHLWNQLDVFGFGGGYRDLVRSNASDDERQGVAARFLIRRVTSMRVGEQKLTKNQYRREWREGGVDRHDQPIEVKDPRQRLVVALVQKKVAELLGADRFNMSFQIGMLASFESFLETAKVKRDDDAATFDDPEQAQEEARDVREGIDVHSVNRLAKDHLARFGTHLPHPKMDAVVESLCSAWRTGRKSLVFVRRVASVKELQLKLERSYDDWLLALLRAELPPEVLPEFEKVVAKFSEEQSVLLQSRDPWAATAASGAARSGENRSAATFFAWYFRGDGPLGFVSGASIARRFTQKSASLFTFFERNHVAEILDADPRDLVRRLVALTSLSDVQLGSEIGKRAARYLGGSTKRLTAGARFLAAQGATLEVIRDLGRDTELSRRAARVHAAIFRDAIERTPANGPVDVIADLRVRTFFTELCRPERAALRAAVWPAPSSGDPVAGIRESELRAQLIGSAVRLGHGLIDFYLLMIARLGSLRPRALESDDIGGGDLADGRIREFLDLLERQRTTPLDARRWAVFDELSEIAQNFHLVLDVNLSEARSGELSELRRLLGTLLGQQQPVGGMFGTVNRTLVQQFRMPGYPFVLVTTDLLQEGEDLHTFCSSIHHYGISWTPSSMEQRTGRIDRVRSQTDRRLGTLDRDHDGDDLLQVHFPHLKDTVEVLQVERVLERMNVFLRLMHEGLATRGREEKQVDVRATLARGRRPVERITETLRTAFDVAPAHLAGEVRELALPSSVLGSYSRRLLAIQRSLTGQLSIDWTDVEHEGQLLGTMRLPSGRIQPFTLLLDSYGERLLLRCVSPVGVVGLTSQEDEILESVHGVRVRLAAIPERDVGSFDLTVQEEVLLAATEFDAVRARLLLERVAEEADRLERVHLPDRDRDLEGFRSDLLREESSFDA